MCYNDTIKTRTSIWTYLPQMMNDFNLVPNWAFGQSEPTEKMVLVLIYSPLPFDWEVLPVTDLQVVRIIKSSSVSKRIFLNCLLK